MRAVILGSAAGGGYPQWNCRCAVCALAWAGDPRVRRRTQSSLAVSADGEAWLLLNCSPDVREQIAATPALWPHASPEHPRGSPIRAVALTNGDVDHVGGLPSLREGSPFDIHATASVRHALAQSPLFGVLAADRVRWREVRPGQPFEPLPGLRVEPFMVPGKVPLYLEGERTPQTDVLGEQTLGFTVWAEAAPSCRLTYVPGCARVDPELRARAASSTVLLFDGTVFHDDELARAGVGEKRGRRMGHLPIAGADGSLAAWRGLEHLRRIYVHVNNTNPVLIADSPERRAIEAEGWTVAHDGMEIRL